VIISQCVLFLFILFSTSEIYSAQEATEYEISYLSASYNDVPIPGNQTYLKSPVTVKKS